MKQRMIYRVLFYLLGLAILSLGVVVSINSGLGISPANSFPYAVSRATGVRMGACVTAIFCFYILLQVLLLRRDFKLKNLTQILFSTAFGYFVDGWKALLGGFALPTYAGKLAMLAASILFIALGLVFVLTPDLVPMPAEGLCLAIVQKKPSWKLSNVKMAFDCTSVALCVAVSLIFCGDLQGVREGTVISALLVGKVLGVGLRWLAPGVKRICFAAPAAAE